MLEGIVVDLKFKDRNRSTKLADYYRVHKRSRKREAQMIFNEGEYTSKKSLLKYLLLTMGQCHPNQKCLGARSRLRLQLGGCKSWKFVSYVRVTGLAWHVPRLHSQLY